VKNVGNFAYAISLSGNVTAFTRNTSTGALSPIGALMGVGSLPFGFAIRPDESFLYLANTGDSTIAAFSIDPATGRLTPVSGSPFDNGAGSKPEALTFDPTGAFLYVANAGTGGIGVYSVNKSTGVLTALASVTGPSFPAAFTWHPNGKFLYVSDQPLSNPTAGAVWAYSINTSTGALTAVPGSPFSTPGTGAHSAAFGANGAYLYVATNNPDAAVPNALTGFRVNSTTGALTLLNGAPFAGITPKNTVATDQTGAYLYIANEADVEGYSISASTGQLTALSGFPITAGSAAYELTFDPANKFVYVGEDGGTSIPVLSFDVATGKLTPIAGSPFMNTYEPDLVGVL
jgi:6-phosphogluconolactonase (cycloisomerase 2 family)